MILAWLVVVVGLVGVVENRSVQHVNLVDVFNATNGHTNFLFRGGDPDSSNSDGTYYFNYDNLVSTMQSAAKSAGYTLPSTFFLYDISFLTDSSANEHGRNDAEYEYFKENPSKGKWLYWEGHGESDDPLNPDIDAGLKKYMALNFQNWGEVSVDWRVGEMNNLLQQEGTLPVIVYGHCMCGCDRTGMMFGSYALRFLGETWKQVSSWDQEIAGRNISCSEYRAMMWYCYYLKESNPTNYGTLDCGHTYQPDCNYPNNGAINEEPTPEEEEKEEPAPESTTVKYVFYVDSKVVGKNENFLFRGGSPDTLSDYGFNYDGTVSAMQAAAKDAGKTLPSSFYMVDITLIGVHSEHDISRGNNEYIYFQKYQDKGEFVMWESHGISNDPALDRVSGRMDYMVDIFPQWDVDHTPERVAALNQYLLSNQSLPVVVYVHDASGYNQNSALMGAYYMQELGWTWHETTSYNIAVHGTETSCVYYRSEQWHCYYLRHHIGGSYQNLDCSHSYQSDCNSHNITSEERNPLFA